MSTLKKSTTTKKTTAKTAKKTTKAVKKTTATKKTTKAVERQYINEILSTLGIDRPYAGLIDQGDFGTVCTYIPLYEQEYKKLSKDLQSYVYVIAPKRYGILAFLPRTFEAVDGGKVVSVETTSNAEGKLLKVKYKTDQGGSFETEHELRREKLLNYAKNKKLPIDKKVK